MKNLKRVLFVALLLALVAGNVEAGAQEKSKSQIRKENREAEKRENIKMATELLELGEFTFAPDRMNIARTGTTRDLMGGWGLMITADMIQCELPFVGKMDVADFNASNSNPLSFTASKFELKSKEVKGKKVKLVYEIDPDDGLNHFTAFITIYPEAGTANLTMNQARGDSTGFTGIIRPNR